MRVFLVGFMGSGKSTIGRRLAKRLGRQFIDLDAEIVRREGRSIPEIFETDGESGFRTCEHAALVAVCETTTSAVVALGGGAFTKENNRRLIAANGVSVWLDASFDTCAARIGDDDGRPLFRDRERARKLFEERRALYTLANFRIGTDDRVPDDIAATIADLVLAVRNQP